MEHKVTVLVSEGSRRAAHNLNDLMLRWAARYDQKLPTFPSDKMGVRGRPAGTLTLEQFVEVIKKADDAALSELRSDLISLKSLIPDEVVSKEEYSRVEKRRRYLGRRISLIQEERARRKAIRRKQAKAVEEAKAQGDVPDFFREFFRAAKEILPSWYFDKVNDQADRIVKEVEMKVKQQVH